MSNKHNGIAGTFAAHSGGAPSGGIHSGRSHKSLNIGHGNYLVTSRIVAILESGSLPMKRLRETACQDNLLVDATAGRKTRSIILTDSRHVVLSALAPQTLQERIHEGPQAGSQAQLEWEEGEFVS